MDNWLEKFSHRIQEIHEAAHDLRAKSQHVAALFGPDNLLAIELYNRSKELHDAAKDIQDDVYAHIQQNVIASKETAERLLRLVPSLLNPRNEDVS